MLCRASYATDDFEIVLFDADQANAQLYAERRARKGRASVPTLQKAMCCIGLADVPRRGRKNLDAYPAVQAAFFRLNKSWNFRESYVAVAVNVAWDVCGLTGHSLICSPTRLQLQRLPNRREIFWTVHRDTRLQEGPTRCTLFSVIF
jgi:hypothetical protein